MKPPYCAMRWSLMRASRKSWNIGAHNKGPTNDWGTLSDGRKPK